MPRSNASQQWLPKIAVVLALLGVGSVAWMVVGAGGGSSSSETTISEAATSGSEEADAATTVASTAPAVTEAPVTTLPRPPWPAPPIPDPPIYAGFGLAYAISDPLIGGMPSDQPTPYLVFAQDVFNKMAADDWAGVAPVFSIANGAEGAVPYEFYMQSQWPAADRLSLLLVDAAPDPDGVGYDLTVAVVANFPGSPPPPPPLSPLPPTPPLPSPPPPVPPPHPLLQIWFSYLSFGWCSLTRSGTISMVRDRLSALAPERAKHAYRLLRKRLGHDIHERVNRVTVSHIYRYMHANQFVDGCKVLDAACGSGYGSMMLTRASEYVGIDLDPLAVAEATREFPEFTFTRGSIYDLPFEDASFSALTSFETLEHVDKPARALGEFSRVLQPGALLVGSIPIDHPDRVYHFRPYSIAEARDIFGSDPRLQVRGLFLQSKSLITECDDATLNAWPGGTLVAHLYRV